MQKAHPEVQALYGCFPPTALLGLAVSVAHSLACLYVQELDGASWKWTKCFFLAYTVGAVHAHVLIMTPIHTYTHTTTLQS